MSRVSGGLVKHLAKNANWQLQLRNGRLNRLPVEPPMSARRGDVIQQAGFQSGSGSPGLSDREEVRKMSDWWTQGPVDRPLGSRD